jgi:hypothetical protein
MKGGQHVTCRLTMKLVISWKLESMHKAKSIRSYRAQGRRSQNRLKQIRCVSFCTDCFRRDFSRTELDVRETNALSWPLFG